MQVIFSLRSAAPCIVYSHEMRHLLKMHFYLAHFSLTHAVHCHVPAAVHLHVHRAHLAPRNRLFVDLRRSDAENVAVNICRSHAMGFPTLTNRPLACRISVIFRVRSAKAVKITDAALLKRLGIICGVIGVCLLVRTIVAPPLVIVGRTADDLKAYLCKTDWWDHTFTSSECIIGASTALRLSRNQFYFVSVEVLFLAWGVRLCIMVRKAPSEFNESRFISMAIYNEFLLTCFLNVSM